MAIDPVCRIDVDTDKTEFQSSYAAKNFYFCSEECKTEFDDRPEDFAGATAVA